MKMYNKKYAKNTYCSLTFQLIIVEKKKKLSKHIPKGRMLEKIYHDFLSIGKRHIVD